MDRQIGLNFEIEIRAYMRGQGSSAFIYKIQRKRIVRFDPGSSVFILICVG